MRFSPFLAPTRIYHYFIKRILIKLDDRKGTISLRDLERSLHLYRLRSDTFLIIPYLQALEELQKIQVIKIECNKSEGKGRPSTQIRLTADSAIYGLGINMIELVIKRLDQKKEQAAKAVVGMVAAG